jgi:hypothetical protein
MGRQQEGQDRNRPGRTTPALSSCLVIDVLRHVLQELVRIAEADEPDDAEPVKH